MDPKAWYVIHDTATTITPALAVFPDRILHNIRTMIAMAGGAESLRPHIKTHKTGEIIQMQMDEGIAKFKCATIAEAELLALHKAPDVLLAMQPVGANIDRFFRLMETYPNVRFSALVDNSEVLLRIAMAAGERTSTANLYIDLNNGMDRTGIRPGEQAVALYREMNANPHIAAKGLHVYDGHIRNPDPVERKKACDRAFRSVTELKATIEGLGMGIGTIIAGGSPTFPFHGQREGVEASPGTTLLWDAGYGNLFPEMDFLPAAVLLSRIISKPNEQRICLDLGHKHLASEMPFPRVQFLKGEGSHQVGQSEEHFVLEFEGGEDRAIGDILYALPVHICPTVAKYEQLLVVSDGTIVDTWKVAARNATLTV